jgi:CRISPR-associated protein Cas5d
MSEQTAASRPFRLRVWSRNACFTRPEMKVERVSYDVMTPSAARGVLEAILWKPAIRWIVERIDVLKPIRWESVRRNEVGTTMSPRSPCLFIEDQRQQRAGLFLRDVDYVIHASLEITDKAGPDDNQTKFQEMFLRRAGKGQCFHRPYLGCREFAADFAPITNGAALPQPLEQTPDLGFGQRRDLGWMLYDVCHDHSRDTSHAHTCTEACRPSFFRAQLDQGRLFVPTPESGEVRS